MTTRIISSAFHSADPNVLREAFNYLGQMGLSESELTAMVGPLLDNSQLPIDVRTGVADLLRNAAQ